VSRIREAAEAPPPAARRQFLPGTSAQWRSVLDDGRRFPLVAVSLTLLGIAAAILAARLLEESFPTFILVCSMIGAAVGLVRPYVAVLAAIVVSPTFGWVVFGPDVSAFQVLVAGAAIGCLRDLWTRPGLLRRLLTRPEVVIALLFVGWLSLAAFARRDASDWGFVRNYAGAVVFLGVLALTLRTTRRRATAVGALLVATVATALVGLAQIVTTNALVSAWVLPDLRVIQETYTRLGSSWGLASGGSDFGKDVLVGFLIAVPLALYGLRRPLRLSLLAAGAILGIALIMSGGRSAWLGGIVGLAYVALVVPRWTARVPAAVAAAGLALLIVFPSAPVDIQTAVGLAPQNQRGGVIGSQAPGGTPAPRLVVGGVRDELSTEMSSNLRRRLAVASLEMVRDEPLLGVGAGAFQKYVDQYEPLPAVRERPIDARPNLPAHNVVLELWADSGTPAAFLFVLFLALVLIRFERHRRKVHDASSALVVGLSAALIGLFVTSLFHNYQYDNLLWVICGVAVSLGVNPPRTATAR
jgi:hypothetical protein